MRRAAGRGAAAPRPSSHDAKLQRPGFGRQWTASDRPCESLAMPSAGTTLVGRLHVDLLRVSSAICPVT
ncbi:putative leader peptide [Kitasatospora sp. NPDC004531]